MTRAYDPSEQFAGNSSIDEDLHEILQRISQPSRTRILKKLRELVHALRKHGSEQVDQGARHLFRELLVGDKLNRAGHHFEYSPKLDGQTPDWYDEENRIIVEVFTCERGGSSRPEERVAEIIEEKVTKYREIIERHSACFVVAVHGDFMTGLDFGDCVDLIRSHRLFERFPELSGVIQFGETCCKPVASPDGSKRMKQLYSYNFIANPSADRTIDLPESLQDP